jgi:hypothetical protein
MSGLTAQPKHVAARAALLIDHVERHMQETLVEEPNVKGRARRFDACMTEEARMQVVLEVGKTSIGTKTEEIDEPWASETL